MLKLLFQRRSVQLSYAALGLLVLHDLAHGDFQSFTLILAMFACVYLLMDRGYMTGDNPDLQRLTAFFTRFNPWIYGMLSLVYFSLALIHQDIIYLAVSCLDLATVQALRNGN